MTRCDVFVTTGTHGQPFDRLVRAADALAGLGLDVVVQASTWRHVPVLARPVGILPSQVWAARVAGAGVVVTHGGPASILGALQAGRRPIVVPRDPAWGEHVDDHQLRYMPYVDPDAIVVVDPLDLVAGWWELAARAGAPLGPRASPTAAFAAAFGALVDRVVGQTSTRKITAPVR